MRYKYASLLPHLDERAQRLVAAAAAREFGHGGIERIAHASLLHRDTIRRGLRELDGDVLPVNCVRLCRMPQYRSRKTTADPNR